MFKVSEFHFKFHRSVLAKWIMGVSFQMSMVGWLVSWSLMSLFSTNMAISEMKDQG